MNQINADKASADYPLLIAEYIEGTLAFTLNLNISGSKHCVQYARIHHENNNNWLHKPIYQSNLSHG